ncbi:lipocalin family protein [Abyssalbus ytuae]|uniref:Lipocalin family protein n=1 Tax=Abyssalbus ytuae TaxID=2926907 RepID=A0A9E7CT46_9FLAO|nr:lipocalin family protein [Abyssalbus ytuae]UOB17456.1 lipocalin family protein [Abyssalbus ytuae]
MQQLTKSNFMNKNAILILSFLLIVMTSCSLSKVNKSYRNSINGTWTLTDVSYENASGQFKSVLFNDAEDICFEGSEWFFRANNSTGYYNIPASSLCEPGNRYIRWSVVEGDSTYHQLQFKFTDEKKKDLSGLGYRLIISSVSDEQMVLRNNVLVDGERVTIVYNFNRKTF